MTETFERRRLGVFTRLIGATPDTPAATVYAEAAAQFVAAERLGFDVGWVAQHHVSLGGRALLTVDVPRARRRNDA
jgi:alkanesulfonate monooxygenase SsuD/methylene tetrahydromethanopterin reductase-like flavin-dependent oxidoreductase (luciferase family)